MRKIVLLLPEERGIDSGKTKKIVYNQVHLKWKLIHKMYRKFNMRNRFRIIDISLNFVYNSPIEILMLNSPFWAFTDQKIIEYSLNSCIVLLY